jgi:hypothetical protein
MCQLRQTRRILSIPSTLSFLCILFATLYAPAQAKQAPWTNLFNGKDFTGWTIKGSTGKAWVQDGEIVCHQVSNTPEHTFVTTDATFTDFILELDVKIDGDFNTGILIRAVDQPKEAKLRLNAYQVKIDPTPRQWTGGVFDDFGPDWHWFYSLENDSRARAAFKIGEWNHFRVEAIGNSIKVWVNGVPTTNMINAKYTSGHIALKIHALGDKPEQEKILAHFKNIRVIDKNPAAYAQPMDLPAKTVD